MALSGSSATGLKVDRGIPSQLDRVPEVARELEDENRWELR